MGNNQLLNLYKRFSTMDGYRGNCSFIILLVPVVSQHRTTLVIIVARLVIIVARLGSSLEVDQVDELYLKLYILVISDCKTHRSNLISIVINKMYHYYHGM